MHTYIVRVYRANPVDDGSVSGVIEDIESGQQKSFHGINDLQSLLTQTVTEGQFEIRDLVTQEADAYDKVVVIWYQR